MNVPSVLVGSSLIVDPYLVLRLPAVAPDGLTRVGGESPAQTVASPTSFAYLISAEPERLHTHLSCGNSELFKTLYTQLSFEVGAPYDKIRNHSNAH